MKTGFIKKWNELQGWGFIECEEEDQDYFFHISKVRKGLKIKEGMSVKFDSTITQRGDEAENMPAKFSLEVEVVEPMGADTLVWSKVGGQEFRFIVDGTTTINSGDSVLVGFDPVYSCIFDLDSEDRL